VNRRADHELWLAGVFAVLAGLGWWRHSIPLALVGVAGLLAALLLYLWQRTCLDGVAYERSLGHDRATFGEEIAFELEIVNDKLLPLTWLHIEDKFPRHLTVRGDLVTDRSERWRFLVTVLPMLPYQRVRRRVTIVCDHRGEHTFGPAEVRSGDPVGYRSRSRRVREELSLLVYPKVFVLEPPGIASRVLLGNQRSRALVGDPSRVVGVREYRPGDPLRHVDWRATARGAGLLVREHEPTASLRVGVFVDLHVPPTVPPSAPPDLVEFVVAVAASVVADLAGRGVAVGLYSAATVHGREIAHAPSSAPSALPEALELLARAFPYGRLSFADVLTREGGRLSRATSVVVVAATFPPPTQLALDELGRRAAVTTIWAASETTEAPPPDGVGDVRLTALYTDDWHHRATLELAP
jgi:uncharacterized protein (DUF58 family)